MKHKQRLVCSGVLAAMVLAAAGCPIIVLPPQLETYTETVRVTMDVDAGGLLNLASVNGTIRIRASEEPELAIEAVKTVDMYRLPGANLQDPSYYLDRIDVNVDREGAVVSVESDYPPDVFDDGLVSASVDYLIHVPTRTDVDVDAVNGTIDIRGVEGAVVVNLVNGDVDVDRTLGDLTLSVTNGQIDVYHPANPEPGTAIDCAVANGEIDIDLPGDGSFTVLAHVTVGDIDARGFGLLVERTLTSADIDGVVGDGEAAVVLDVETGSIDMRAL